MLVCCFTTFMCSLPCPRIAEIQFFILNYRRPFSCLLFCHSTVIASNNRTMATNFSWEVPLRPGSMIWESINVPNNARRIAEYSSVSDHPIERIERLEEQLAFSIELETNMVGQLLIAQGHFASSEWLKDSIKLAEYAAEYSFTLLTRHELENDCNLETWKDPETHVLLIGRRGGGNNRINIADEGVNQSTSPSIKKVSRSRIDCFIATLKNLQSFLSRNSKFKSTALSGR